MHTYDARISFKSEDPFEAEPASKTGARGSSIWHNSSWSTGSSWLASGGHAVHLFIGVKLVVSSASPQVAEASDGSSAHAQDVWLTTKDGQKLHAWFMQPKKWGGLGSRGRPRRSSVLFFQENAGNMSYRLPFLFLLSRTLDCSILAPR